MLSPQQSAQYNLAIVGSRDFDDYDLLLETVNDALQEWGIKYSDILRIVSGGAKGADTLARQFAEDYGIEIKEYLPDWKIGKAAGIIRNKDIIADATHVIAFPSVKGKGTQNSISLAKKAGLPLRVVFIDKPPAY